MDIRYVAHLARLHLTEQEIKLFQDQLGDVLKYVQDLSELDVAGVEPTAHAMAVTNVFRADETLAGLDREAVLSNAPSTRNNLFIVPKIVE